MVIGCLQNWAKSTEPCIKFFFFDIGGDFFEFGMREIDYDTEYGHIATVSEKDSETHRYPYAWGVNLH